MDSRPIPIGTETNQMFSRQDFLNIPRNPNSQREAGIEDNQQRALVLIDEIGQILNKDKIGRDDINAINRKYQKIDAMERHEYTSVEASSVRVLTVLIRKVKLIAIAEGSISAQGLVSLFFLSKFNDFPQITTIFKETVAKLNSLNQKRIKALDRRIVQVIPHCESEMQFNKDMVELLKTVDPSLSNSEIDELIKKRIQLFREMSSRQEEQRKTEEAFHARRRILGEGVSNVFSKKSSLEGEKRLAPETGPEPDFQPEPNSSVLAELEQEIQLKPELQSAIEQARKMKEQQNNNDILVFLGTTQVGKSSTLNFLSGQTPFIERGFVHVSDFEIQNDLFEFSLDKEDAFLIINYLVDQKLLRWIKERDFYIPTFRNGARILATEENMEKEALKDFISRKFQNKDLNEIYNFVIRQLTAKTEKLEKSSKGHPSIGYRNPIFTYGFGLFSTTIIAQVKQQDWNVTTVDLPGTGEIKGKEYSLVSAYSTFTSLNNTQTVRGAVILLAYDQLAGGSTTAASMIQVLKSADNILGNAIDMDNICILVTKIPLVVTEIEFTGE